MSDKVDSQPNKHTFTLDQALDLGVKHHTAGELAEAEKVYNQILEADPNQPQALHFLGMIAQQLGQNQKAVYFIEKAISVQPDFAEAHSNLGNALRGLGRQEEAVANYEKATILQPNYAEAHNNLGVVLKEMGQLLIIQGSSWSTDRK